MKLFVWCLVFLMLCIGVMADCYPVYDLTAEFIEGEEKQFFIGGTVYTIEVKDINDDVRMRVNGESVSADVCDTESVDDLHITPIEVIGDRTTLAFFVPGQTGATCNPLSHLTSSIQEGEMKAYVIEGWEYEITAVEVDGSGVQFQVNGQLLGEQHACAVATYNVPNNQLVVTPTKIVGREVEFAMYGRTFDSDCEPESHLIDEISEGERKAYAVEGWEYEVTALAVDGKAKLQLNGDVLPALDECDAYLVYQPTRSLWVTALDINGQSVEFSLRADDVPVELPEPEIEEEYVEEPEVPETVPLTPPMPPVADPEEVIEATPPPEPVCAGCLSEGNCVPVGMRLDGNHYCSINREVRSQYVDEAGCNNHYECISNQCYNGQCTSLDKDIKESKGLLEKIVGWFSRLFG